MSYNIYFYVISNNNILDIILTRTLWDYVEIHYEYSWEHKYS